MAKRITKSRGIRFTENEYTDICEAADRAKVPVAVYLYDLHRKNDQVVRFEEAMTRMETKIDGAVRVVQRAIQSFMDKFGTLMDKFEVVE